MDGSVRRQWAGRAVCLEEEGPMRRLQLPQDVGVKPVLPADVQEVLVIKEEVPWSPSLDQDQEFLHEQEDQEELWAGPDDGDQFNGQEEADFIRFTFTGGAMKSECDEETPQSSQFHHHGHTEDTREATTSPIKWIKTETDEEDYGGPEPAWNPDPRWHFQPNTDGNASDTSETDDTDDDDDDDEDSGGYWQEPLSDCGPEIDDGGWKSTVAPESALNSQNVDSQMMVHTGVKLFGCDVCGKRFTHQQNLKTHMRIHTGEKPFVCNICGKRSRHQNTLKTHMRIHTGEKPFVCDICGKRSRHQNNLKVHMMIHTGEKPFGCDICGRRFSRKSHLRTHLIVHTGEKPFGCDICGKRFNRKTHIRTHMIVHSGEKPYSCDVCGRRFNRKTHLETHTTVHTGEKPYCCAVCGQGFTQQGSLNRHMRFHLG